MKKLLSFVLAGLLLACQLPALAQMRSTGGLMKAANAPIRTTPGMMLANTYSKKIGNTTLTLSKTTADKTTKPAANIVVAATGETKEGTMVCRTETRRYTAETMSQDMLTTEAVNSIKLGAVYSLVRMQNGDYSTVDAGRAPVDIGLSDGTSHETVANPTEVTLREATNRVRSIPFATTPAGFGGFLSATQVTSSESLNLAAGLSYSGFGFNASDKFKYDKNSTTNKFLLTAICPTYTVEATPTPPASLFFTDPALNADGTLAYVSQVTYGMKLMVYFEGNVNTEDVNNKVQFSGFGANGNLDVEYQSRLANTKFQIFLYGSNEPVFVAMGYNDMLAKVNGLLSRMTIKDMKVPLEMGKPLSYQLKFLDGGVAVTSCRVEDAPQRICGPDPNYPVDFSLSVDGLEFEGGSYYGWLDAEISGGEKPLPVWAADANAAAFRSIVPPSANSANPPPPMLNLRFPQVTKALRDNGVLRVWYRVINRNVGGNDVFLNKLNTTTFDFANNGQHGPYKGNFVDFPLKDFLGLKPGDKKQVKVRLTNQDKAVTLTLTPQFLFQ